MVDVWPTLSKKPTPGVLNRSFNYLKVDIRCHASCSVILVKRLLDENLESSG